jgi:chromosome segregation ATPase
MASLTDDPRAFHQAEVKWKQYEESKAEREYRSPDVPESVPARITRLSKEVAEAGHALDGARRGLDDVQRLKNECHARFTHLSEELMQAIHEHREGTPENAPYQP